MLLKQKKINITGIRVLTLLKILSQGSFSKEELLKIMQTKENLKISPETLRLDINTLKSASFLIESIKKGKEYKYSLQENPLNLNFTKRQIAALESLKKNISEIADWNYIIELYQVLEKISYFIQDENYKNKFLNFPYFKNLDLKLIKELYLHCQNKHEITILYNSPIDEKNIRLRCKELEYNHKSKKMYLVCRLEGYDYLSWLRADKIKGIISVSLKPEIKNIEDKYSIYKIKTHALDYFDLSKDEEIIEQNENYTTIKIRIKNDFFLMQHLIMLGENVVDCDLEIKNLIKEKIEKTMELYK